MEARFDLRDGALGAAGGGYEHVPGLRVDGDVNALLDAALEDLVGGGGGCSLDPVDELRCSEGT